MLMSATISLHGGGPGSGCRGPNCGRKSTGMSERTEAFYHGTVLPSAKAILQQGLIPHPSTAFHIGHIPVRSGYIYATKDESEAKQFARVRAAYESMSPGSTRVVGFGQDKPGEEFRFWKAKDAPPASADKPVAAVVEMELPEHLANKFGDDPDSLRGDDLTAKGIIPPQFIKSVEVLSGDKWKKYSRDEVDKIAAQTGSSTYLVYFGPIEALKTHLKAGNNAA